MFFIGRIKQFEFFKCVRDHVDTLLERCSAPNGGSDSVTVSKIIYEDGQTKNRDQAHADNYTPRASTRNDDRGTNNSDCPCREAQEARRHQARNRVNRQRSQPETSPFVIALIQGSPQAKHHTQHPYRPRILHYGANARDRTKEAEPVAQNVPTNETK